jgi:hypothetical protein
LEEKKKRKNKEQFYLRRRVERRAELRAADLRRAAIALHLRLKNSTS